MIIRHFDDLRPLKAVIRKNYEEMKESNDDKVLIITGNTGSGKSYLALELFEYYYKDILQIPLTEDLFEFFAITDRDWINAISLAKDKPFYCIPHDESVNILYAKDAITKKNKTVNKLFKQIRGKRLYHIMLIPQVHRLDREFRDDRVSAIINIKKVRSRDGKSRRILDYYSPSRSKTLLNELDLMKKDYKDKKQKTSLDACKTPPNFSCTIPEYKGMFLELYAPKKDANMDDSIDSTLNAIVEGRGEEVNKKVDNSILKKLAYKKHLEGKKNTEIAEILDVTETSIRRWVKDEKKIQQKSASSS